MAKKKAWGLTGNQLKLLAMVLMTVDHIGMLLLPQFLLLRIIGRLAMPIFAYMIAEGCAHTRSKGKYLLRLAVCALITQLVMYYVGGSLYQSIFVTFSFSVLLVMALEHASKHGILSWLLPLLLGCALWGICEELPKHISGYAVDYGFFGVLLPVIICLGKDRLSRFWLAAAGLALLCWYYGGIQWYAMAALVLLALYSGSRGKARLKWLFYLYYPFHIAVLYILAYYLY